MSCFYLELYTFKWWKNVILWYKIILLCSQFLVCILLLYPNECGINFMMFAFAKANIIKAGSTFACGIDLKTYAF